METPEPYQISHEEMRKYAGKYVAVMDGKVVASGKNLYQKIEELEKKYPDKKILVTYIPQKTYSSHNSKLSPHTNQSLILLTFSVYYSTHLFQFCESHP